MPQSKPVTTSITSYGSGGQSNPAEPNRYYYHPDHLGSTSYITDASGEVYQHLEYFAFGETFVEEHSNTDRTPYLYNGKELDEETGLYYYGARYYDARTSVWVSVDPLAEKYPGLSGYNYVANNPLKFVDPNGMAIYYNKRGREIGEDEKGAEDNKIVIVTNNKEARQIKRNTKKASKAEKKYGARSTDRFVDASSVNSGVTLDRDAGVGVLNAITRVDTDTDPSTNDNSGLHEEGGHQENGNVVNWSTGNTRTLNSGGSITPFNGVSTPSVSDLDVYWHVHTNKKLKFTDANGKERTQTGSTNPSPADYAIQSRLEASGYTGYAIQVGTSGEQVNFYRGSGTFFEISIKRFRRAVNNN